MFWRHDDGRYEPLDTKDGCGNSEYMVCPICRDMNTHDLSPIFCNSGEYKGGVTVIPMYCEARSHMFELCIGHHKGQTAIFMQSAKFSLEILKRQLDPVEFMREVVNNINE